MSITHVRRTAGLLLCAGFALLLPARMILAQSDVRPVGYSGEADAGLFDAHLVNDASPVEGTPTADSPPASCTPRLPGHCSDSPRLISPESVFSPTAPAPPAMNQTQPLVASLGAGQGALTAQNSVPTFLGDYFGGAGTQITGTYNEIINNNSVAIPLTNGVGVMKLAENTSPIPRDRVFLSYNYFDNVNMIPGGLAVNRLTPGFEKTFFDGRTSVELRIPMATTLSSNTTYNQGNFNSNISPVNFDSNQYELGNLTMFFKGLIYQDEQFALSTGLGVAAPTADGLEIATQYGDPVATITNQSWHLLPFVGAVYTPSDRWYAQGMMQIDISTNGSSVFAPDPYGNLTKIGHINDPNYLFSSVGTGYWFYDAADQSSLLTRASAFTELHFNNSLQATDTVRNFDLTVGSRQDRIQTVNAVIGTNLILHQNKSLMLGYVAPLGGGSDRAFDGEFRLLFNWYFGAPLNRATSVQF